MKKTQKSIIAVILTLALVLSQAFTVYGSNMVPQKDTNIVSADSVEELPSKGDKIVNKSEQEGVIPGKIMVKYKDYSSLRMMSGLNASDSAVSGKSIRNLNIIELEIADDADVLEAVDKLNADPNVEFAEPVYERRAVNNSTVVDSVYCEDEFYKKGWQWGLEAVNMDKMWGTVEEEYQSDIVIAVIDSGVDIDHSEFEGRIVNGYDFINVDNDPDDDYGHGTHVAGIAAAGNDGYGMAGVASKAKIMPIKVLDENGFGDTVSVVNGILYAINQGADVINLSFGGRSASQSEFLAIQYALDNGVVVVAAAGNDDSSSLDYPANYDGVISVGAADWNNAGFGMAEFSNYGSRIDMVAPGVDILSTIPEELDTRFDGDGDGIKDGYTLMSGTSMSTPFVSGMAAMLLAYSKQMDVNLEVGALNRCDTLLRMMKASAYEFSEYYLVNGSMDEGNINPPFMDKKLMLTASVLLEDDMVELFLKGSNYRNEPSDTIEDTFKAYMMPYSIDESGKRYFGIYEEVGEISLIDGEGNIEVPVEKGSNYLFFVEGNDAYLSAAVVGVEIPYNNGSFESALELQTGRGRYNKFNSRDEKHYYKFTTSPGEAAEYNIYSTGGTDVYVDLYNSDEQHVTYDDDGGIGWNFDMTRTLDADSIYYIKVGTYGVGEYGVVVEGGNADENTADFIEVSGTISLPEGIVADEDIVGAIGLIEKSWIEQDGRAEYNPGKSENFIMTEGTSDVSYTLKVPSGKEYILGCQLIFDPDDLEYILLEYIPLGLYGSNGTVTNIDEAEIITTTQEANMILLPKASVESPERAFDTVESAGELIPGSNITEKVDYVLDRDFYHITVSDPGYYMLDLKIDGLDDMINNRRGAPIEIRFMDAEGNDYYFYRVPELIYADNKIVGMSLIQELSVGDYYYVITSSDMDSVDRLKLCEYELSFNKASQITCDIRLPENLINYDGVFGLYDNQGMGYVLDPEAYYGDRSVLDDSGKKSSLSYEAQGNNNEFLSLFVPYDSQASYILGYSMYTYDEYSDMGYYAHENIAGIDIGFTVDNMTDATPIYAGEESSISFEVEFIADTGNDSMETAFILVPNTFIKGTINREMDMDYFKFDAPVAGNYQISYEGNLIGRSVKKSIRADNKLGLFVYENDKWVQYAEDVKGNISRHFSEGEHYIKIGGTQDSDHSTLGPYKLLLNCSPFVENVHISGSPKVGSTLTSAYIYTDADGDLEGNSRYRWLRADSITSEYSAISGAVNKTYTLTSTDIGKYIKFEVLPVTAIAPEVGEAVLSNAVGPVAAVRTGGGGGGGGSSSGQKENVDNAKTESTASGSAAFTEGLNGSTNAVLKVESSKIAAMLNASGTSPVKIDVKTSINAQNVEIVLAADILAKTDKLQKTVVIEANDVSFEIQPNTLDSDGSNVDLTLRVDELSLDAVPEAQRNKDATADDVSMVFDFGMYLGDKKVTEFNKPVTITVKYDASKVTDTSKLGVYYYNEKDSKWEYVGGKVNTDGTITFEVEHFSKYAAMEYTKTFDDITKHWAKKDIEIIIGRHITNGVDNNNFKPDLSITRAEFVTMLVRALNLKTTSDKIFEDVPASAWFKEYIQKAYAAGIIRNSDSDHFSPTDFITREQMAEMLVNAYSYASDKNIGDMRTTQQIRFKDEEMADNSVGNSIILANALKLMVGNPDGTFAPKANATRAQTAVTIRRLLQELKLITEESLSIEMN